MIWTVGITGVNLLEFPTPWKLSSNNIFLLLCLLFCLFNSLRLSDYRCMKDYNKSKDDKNQCYKGI